MYVNGRTLRERFCLREHYNTTSFEGREMSLGEYFSQDFSRYRGRQVHALPEFAFYKSDDEPFVWESVNYMKHPIDFRNRVCIVVSELDRVKLKPSRPMSPEAWAEFTRRPLTEVLQAVEGGEFWRRHRYTVGLLGKLREDRRVLFAYVSTSGVGLRLGFYFRDGLDMAGYAAACSSYTRQIWEDYDHERLLVPDDNACRGDFYWFAPVWPYVWVNPKCEALRCV